MSGSLLDQLKKSGLVNDHQARKAESEKRKQQRQGRGKGKPVPVDEARQLARIAAAEKAERDRELNRQRQAQTEHRALAAQVRQLVETHRLAREHGDVAYHFTDGKLIKRLDLPAALHRKVVEGAAAIVRLGDGYEVVPAAVAERIEARDPSMVLVRNRPGRRDDEDDPYAGHEVPDDLMW